MPHTKLESYALHAAARAIPYATGHIYSSNRILDIAREAEKRLLADDSRLLDPNLIDGLSQSQLAKLESTIDSPAFTHLSLQEMIFARDKIAESQHAYLHGQIRGLLQGSSIYDDFNLASATDLTYNLLNRCVEAITAVAGLPRRADGSASVANVVAAATHNSQILGRIDNLHDINIFAEALRTQARAMHTKISTSHIGAGEGIDYSNLYITPTLKTRGEEVSRNRLATASLRTTILGDPGAGKSTLTSKLVHDIASDRISELQGCVPILIIVRRHAAELRAEHHTLLHYLQQVCRQPYNLEPPPDALEYLLLNGRAFVIIDGVDELGDGHYRQAFATMVNGFAHRYPLTKVLVTSRVIGYRDAPLDADLFPIASILPFTDAQVEQYARKWFGIDSLIDEIDKESWVSSFLNASQPAKDLRTNPLLISLLCALFHSRRSLPRNKPEIYEKCAELLFDLWDRQRGIEAPYYFASYIRPAVQQIAWLMFNDPEGRQSLPRSELRQFLAEYMLAKRFPDPDEAIQAADDFLEFCSDRAWVLTEIGSDRLRPQYGFVHRTFLEFFAASQLVRRGPDPADVWSVLRTKITSGEWDVVAQLAVQVLDRSRDDGADGLLELVIREASRELPTDTERGAALVAFAARTLDNVAPTNARVESIVSRAVRLASDVPTFSRRLLGPTADATIYADAPMAAIFRLQNPDNAERAARTASDELDREVRTGRIGRTAPLLHAVLRELSLSSPVGDAVHQQLRSVSAPAEASEWWYKIFSPSAVDIREYGLSWLYAYTDVFGYQIPSTLSRLLGARYSDKSSSEAESLAHWLDGAYEVIVRQWPPQGLPDDLDAELMLRIASIRGADFEALTPRGKGSLLALLVPVLRSFARSYHTSGSAAFVKLLAGAITRDLSDAGRSKTILAINGYELPSEAHSIVVSQIL